MSFDLEFANCGCAICSGNFSADDTTQATGGTTPVNAPTFTPDQVINQIDSGRAWSGNTINFGFLNGDPGWTQGEGTGFVAFNTAQRNATREIMELFDEIVAPDIVETGGNPADADINFGNTSTNIGYAHAYYPSDFWDIGGSVWLNAPGYGSLYNPQVGNYAYLTIIHEVGHAMGLSHPGAYNGGSPTYANDAEYAQDTRQYSVMSYFSANNTGADFNGGTGWKYPQTLMVHDILTLHSIYGADTNTRDGNTTYGFNSNANNWIYDFDQNATPVLTIFDAGGVDTLDLSGFSQRAIVDLTPGAYSSVGGVSNTMTNNLGIAYGTWIENAIGGSGNDSITGNSLSNILIGGDGADQLFGGGGNDLLVVDIDDTVVQGGAGLDRVLFHGTEDFSFSLLGTDVEYVRSRDGNDNLDASGVSTNVQLFGEAGNDVLTGGNGSNYIDGGSGNDILNGGNQVDTLIGGAGADEMYGGGGNDLFFVDINDTVIQGGAGLDRVVFQGPQDFDFSLAGTGIEYVRGSTGNDTLDASGVTLNVQLFGEGGNDVLTAGDGLSYVDGGSGADILNGGDGHDTLIGGAGADELYGGGGNDLLIVDIADTVIQGGAGADRVVFQGSQAFNFDLLGTGIEYVRSSTGNDNLDATGVTSNVQLFGEGGNDTLTSGLGNDILTGGSGADRFVFGSNTGNDIIADWEDGVDLIDFTQNGNVTSLSDLALVNEGAHTRITYDGNSLLVLNSAGDIDDTDFDFV